jgi:U3 small nucleolar ribonucleoprotein protein IMP4
MQVTTSRKPSPGTRRFARTLARFLGVPYVTRGKMNLDPEEMWILVVEGHGNPQGLAKRFQSREEIIRFSVSAEHPAPPPQKGKKTLVVGSSEKAESVAKFFDLVWQPEAETEAKMIKVTDKTVEFKDGGEAILKLRIYEGPR